MAEIADRPAVVVVESDPRHRRTLVRALGPGTVAVASVGEATAHLLPTVGDQRRRSPVVVVSGPSVTPGAALRLTASCPGSVVVAVHGRASTAELRRAVAAGVGDLVSSDAPAAQLRHAVRRAGVAAQVRAGPPDAAAPGRAEEDTPPPPPAVRAEPAGGVVAVLSPKGGTGGTTVAVNLALALAGGEPAAAGGAPLAVVVDADLQFGDAALVCGVDPGRSLASLVRAAEGRPPPLPDATAVGRALVRVPGTAVDLLAAPVDPALAETLSADLVAAVLDALGDLAGWVVVDLPALIDDRALAVLDRADVVVVVVSPDPLALKDARSVTDLLGRLGLGARWSVVCNVPAPGTQRGVVSPGHHLGRRVAVTIPHDPAVPAAVVHGRPLLIDAPDAPASRALGALAAVLQGPHPTRPAAAAPWRGVVDRLIDAAWPPRRPGG